MAKISLRIGLIFFSLTACSKLHINFNKSLKAERKYNKWYNDKEVEEAKQKGREPKLIEKDNFKL